MSTNSCYFCQKESSNRELYSCPRCGVRYCSVNCYKNVDHASCSESFFREWIENDLDKDDVFDRATRSENERDESAFGKKADVKREIFDFSADKAENVDEGTVNRKLQELGITDPNDIEELLDALTDEEKEHFLNTVGSGCLEETGNEEDGTPSSSKKGSISPITPWWSRSSGKVVENHILDEDLPPDELLSDIFARLKSISIPSEIASTLRFDILNTITGYCVVFRESNLKNFWSTADESAVVNASFRFSEISGSVSSTENFKSTMTAMENVFYKAISNDNLRQEIKSDLKAIFKNFDWRKDESAIGRKSFAFLALFDSWTLYTKARKIIRDSETMKNYFRIIKKLEFYLKWSECNSDLRSLVDEIDARF